jgi:hypothetical protein
MSKGKRKPATTKRVYDARRDTADFRDLMFVPTLVEVPTTRPPEDFRSVNVPVLDQGSEGACTGFGLATVANYLLLRRRVVPDSVLVSPRMLYEMARRYDEWPGEDYSGSSARGAMKGWNKHGVCAEGDWPTPPKKDDPRGLNAARTVSALQRPLGAYFRVNHQDLIAMHAAIAEVGVLYATASVHSGWEQVGIDGRIHQIDDFVGAHAFAIVAYDADGFWIQNSWGNGWGDGGLGLITYDDWLANGTDVWVARLGAPVILRHVASTAIAHASTSGQSSAYSYADIRPHIVNLGHNGELDPGGDYGTSPDELRQIFEEDIPRAIDTWSTKRLLLYAHGGLVKAEAAVQRVAEYRPAMLASEVYPLAFIWHSDFWTTITNILQDAVRRRRPEGVLDATKDFLLDRFDDAMEPLARVLTGHAAWNEMKENALGASSARGGARLVLGHIATLFKRFPALEIHIVAHSAGAILQAPLVQLLTAQGPVPSGPMSGETGLGLKVSTCTLWAPACTTDLFKAAYMPSIAAGTLERFSLFTLTDKAEQDDNCANIYHKSLLYLVSNALEDPARIPLVRDGVPLLGMSKFIEQDPVLRSLFAGSRGSGGNLGSGGGVAQQVIAPNQEPPGSPSASGARHHGDFDDDRATVLATLARILTGSKGPSKGQAPLAPDAADMLNFMPSATRLRARRLAIDVQTSLR